jgi:hypothetical protein
MAEPTVPISKAEELEGSAAGFFKKLVLGLVALLVLGTLGFLWVANWTYSDGTRAGYLTKVSRKGVVFKTYEGELNLGGFRAGTDEAVVGNTWDFSVKEDAVYQELQSHEGQKVTLYYKQQYKNLPWQGKTDYFVYKVEIVPERP